MAPASHDPKRNQYGSSIIRQCMYTYIIVIRTYKTIIIIVLRVFGRRGVPFH